MLHLLLLITGVGGFTSSTCSSSSSIDCGLLTKPSEIARCASEQFDCGTMSQAEWERHTHTALKKADPGQTYYSIGVEWGDVASIAMAKQTGYSFDWSLKLPLAIPHYSNAPLFVADSSMERSLLVYSMSTVKAPTMERKDWWYAKAGGSGRWARVYNLPGAAAVKKMSVSCTGLSSNADLEALKKRKGIVAVMDPRVWCPDEILKDFDIFVGEMRMVKVRLAGVEEEAYVLSNGEMRTGSKVVTIGRGNQKTVF